jgi:hypothetical protein
MAENEQRDDLHSDNRRSRLARIVGLVLGNITLLSISLSISFGAVYAASNYTTLLSDSSDKSDFAFSAQNCANDQLVTGFDSTGLIICAPIPGSADNSLPIVIPHPDGRDCPPGSYPVGVDD